MQNQTAGNQPQTPYTPSCPYQQNTNVAQPAVPSVPYSTTTPSTPSIPQPIYPPVQEGPPTMSVDYIPGYLASNIGRNVRAEFILGTSQFTDKTGVLVDVGINYFVLQDINSRAYIMCDLYSVRFVTLLY